MFTKSLCSRLGVACAAIGLIVLACRLAIAAPGLGYDCATFYLAVNSSCPCPITPIPPYNGDFCANSRPDIWWSDGAGSYLPHCMDMGSSEPPDPPGYYTCDEPVNACGAQIYNCTIPCNGTQNPGSVSCDIDTDKPQGCANMGYFGCAGAPGANECCD